MKSLFELMTPLQWKCWNEGLDHHPKDLADCPYEPGTEEYAYFEDGWWYADNE